MAIDRGSLRPGCWRSKPSLQLTRRELITGLASPFLGARQVKISGKEANQIGGIGARRTPLPPLLGAGILPAREQRAVNNAILRGWASLRQLIQGFNQRFLA